MSLPPDAAWVTVALLGRVRGNRGELAAVGLSGNPERYGQLREVFLFGDGRRLEVESVWRHESRWIFKFRGIDTISDAEPLQGAEVRIPAGERPRLPAGEFYQSDLIGCEVIERGSGEPLGQVTGWQDAGGAGLLEIGGGLLVPFARELCVSIDVDRRRIVVDLPEGLKDLNRP